MESSSLAILIQRYIHDELSEEELTQLWESLRTPEFRAQWDAAMAALLEDTEAHSLSDPAQKERVWKALQPTQPKRIIPREWRWAAAAAVIAAMAIAGSYFVFNKQTSPTINIAVRPLTKPATSAQPGSNKAVLTLADGTQVPLDSSVNGALAVQGNAHVLQQGKGQLTYTDNGNAPTEMQYNNLHIPRGGQFRVTLSDGTKVWLNAASDLRYPVSFRGEERRVELTGEAYFEVTQVPSHPFKVIVNNMEVQVLGTSFNITAYGDEAITKTTLLDGAVKVKTGTHEMQLRPGQQAQTVASGQLRVKDDIDIDEVTAWKNGYFQFNHEKITGVMNQLSRWYDLEVSYQGPVTTREFGGRIARSSSIEQIVKILELSKIHVKIDDRKMIVMP